MKQRYSKEREAYIKANYTSEMFRAMSIPFASDTPGSYDAVDSFKESKFTAKEIKAIISRVREHLGNLRLEKIVTRYPTSIVMTLSDPFIIAKTGCWFDNSIGQFSANKSLSVYDERKREFIDTEGHFELKINKSASKEFIRYDMFVNDTLRIIPNKQSGGIYEERHLADILMRDLLKAISFCISYEQKIFKTVKIYAK